MSRSALFTTALAHHRAGQLAAADADYAQLIAAHPRDPAALHGWALLAAQQQNFAAALDRIDRALAMAPTDPSLHNTRGRVLQSAGQPDAAVAAYTRSIELDPALADAHNNLGHAASAAGDLDRAIATYARAAELAPAASLFHSNLALALGKAGRIEPSLAAHRQAVAAEPNSAAAHDLLAVALREAGQLEDAVAAHERAVALNPQSAEAHNNHGNTLRRLDRLDQAIAAYRRAIAASPRYAAAHSNLAAALAGAGDSSGAMEAAAAALAIDPHLPEAHNHHGAALAAAGRFADAAAAYRRAIALRSGYAEAHSNLALALLDAADDVDAPPIDEVAILAPARRAIELEPTLGPAHANLAQILLSLGRFDQAWPEHEWRFRCNPRYRARPFPQPQWRGEPLHDRTLLIHAEQGFGDAIHFIRYAPLVAAQHPAARIVVECHPELVELFADLPGIAQLVAAGNPLPPFDLHCPLLSLPLACGITLQTIPAGAPYLHARPHRLEQWSRSLGPRQPHERRVGLVWAGRPTHSNDPRRSMRLSDFAALAAVPNVTFHSLQKGPAADQATSPPPGLRLIDHAVALTDFGQTAALIGQMDAVIAVDTAVAHLAGAMGVPVWLLLPRSPDWRWLRRRSDSPWYPTMRIVRQTRWGEWGDVVKRLAGELQMDDSAPII